MNKCVVSRYNAVHSYKKKLSRLLKAHLKNRNKKFKKLGIVRCARYTKVFLACYSSSVLLFSRHWAWGRLRFTAVRDDSPRHSKNRGRRRCKNAKRKWNDTINFFFFFLMVHIFPSSSFKWLLPFALIPHFIIDRRVAHTKKKERNDPIWLEWSQRAPHLTLDAWFVCAHFPSCYSKNLTEITLLCLTQSSRWLQCLLFMLK